MKYILMAICLLMCISKESSAEETRMSLIIDEQTYENGMSNPNDETKTVSETLRSIGFETTYEKNIDKRQLEEKIEEYISRAKSSGKETISIIYIYGQIVQFGGKNRLIPSDFNYEQPRDMIEKTIDLDDLIERMPNMELKGSMMFLNVPPEFNQELEKLPTSIGLAPPVIPNGSIIAFNSFPGERAIDVLPGRDAYAKIFNETIMEGGVSQYGFPVRLRLKMYEMSEGRQISWSSFRSSDNGNFTFVERSIYEPPIYDKKTVENFNTPIENLDEDWAYLVTVAICTNHSFENFMEKFPNSKHYYTVRHFYSLYEEGMKWKNVVSNPEERTTYAKKTNKRRIEEVNSLDGLNIEQIESQATNLNKEDIIYLDETETRTFYSSGINRQDTRYYYVKPYNEQRRQQNEQEMRRPETQTRRRQNDFNDERNGDKKINQENKREEKTRQPRDVVEPPSLEEYKKTPSMGPTFIPHIDRPPTIINGNNREQMKEKPTEIPQNNQNREIHTPQIQPTQNSRSLQNLIRQKCMETNTCK